MSKALKRAEDTEREAATQMQHAHDSLASLRKQLEECERQKSVRVVHTHTHTH